MKQTRRQGRSRQHAPPRPYRPAARRGLTLAECLIASAILALVVAAIVQSVSAGQMQSHHALRGTRAMALAQALLEEVLSLPYADPQGDTSPGPDGGESSRTLFDNADDFHGYIEQPGAMRDAAGTLYPPEYQAFTRRVTAQYSTLTITGLGSVPALTVSVLVSDAQGGRWQVSRVIPQPVGGGGGP